MKDREFFEAAVLGLLLAILGILWIGFSEIMQRLRPRVLYVYPGADDNTGKRSAGERSEAEVGKSQKPTPGELEVNAKSEKPVKQRENTGTTPIFGSKEPIPSR